MSNIKDYRGKELLWYIIAQIFLIVIFQNPNILNFDLTKWQETLVKVVTSTVFSSIIGVFSFVFDAMFSDELKYKCLYLGMKRPGELIFSTIQNRHTDFRYTKEKALEAYKTIYDNMPDSSIDKKAYENDQWYQIYNRYRSIPMIYNSQRDYLLCRDIYFATVIITVFYVLISILLKDVTFSLRFIVLEAVFLISANVATRQRGKRFVANVIAYDLQEKPKNAIAV